MTLWVQTPLGPPLNIGMKLKLTPQRLAANRANCKAGGSAYAKKMRELYESNPAFCSHCQIKLPQSKKRNKFCSSSCAGKFNNKDKKGVLKIKRNPCQNCGTLVKGTSGKYCSRMCSAEASKLYKDPDRALQYKRNRVREASANYRASVRNQTPIDADRKAIQEFYKNCPIGYEVDHIIPISKGGLHTLENLQYLTVTENRRKSNKIIV